MLFDLEIFVSFFVVFLRNKLLQTQGNFLLIFLMPQFRCFYFFLTSLRQIVSFCSEAFFEKAVSNKAYITIKGKNETQTQN